MKMSTPTNQFSAVSVHAHLTSNVKGKQVPFTDEQLHQITDWKRVCKIYKLPAMLSSGTDSRGEGAVNGDTKVDDWQEAEMIILGAMALRGAS
jgi:EKC/KEOPS complex subunit CGI121/TPRKB